MRAARAVRRAGTVIDNFVSLSMWTTVTHGTRGLGDVGDVRLALLVGSYISVVLWVVGPVVPGAGGPVVSGASFVVFCAPVVSWVSPYIFTSSRHCC